MNNTTQRIWIYWDQGWDNTPEIVAKCFKTWNDNNNNWEIIQLSKENLELYVVLNDEIPGINNKTISLTSQSDIIRIILLKKYGGIWVDSTTYCCMPLDNWLPYFFKYDFWGFSKPSKDRLISSWFLYAKKKSYIINRWYEETIEFWKNNNYTEEYFWFHKIFNNLYYSDKTFKQLWDSTPEVLASEAHFFIPYEKTFFTTINNTILDSINMNRTPLYKLTYKYNPEISSKNTIVEYLVSENIINKTPRIIVTWYGSFSESGTIGDYLSVKALTEQLASNNLTFDCLCYKSFEGLRGKIILTDELNPDNYDILIFCCGPIIKDHPFLIDIINKFKKCFKIGLGISLFPNNHSNYFNPFDIVYARENGDGEFNDIAIIASTNKDKIKKIKKPFTIGLVLRNFQTEYGEENCMHGETNSILNTLAKRLLKKYNSPVKFLFKSNKEKARIITIENHLERSRMTPQEIEDLYLSCDIILTSRFHGFIIAIKNNIPVIAIDQINNGAKVFNLISRTGYPYVWKINEAKDSVLYKAAKELLKDKKNHIMVTKNHIIEDANESINEFTKQFASFLFRRMH